MADYVLKYADGRGQIHQQVATATSEKELREKYAQQGFLIYSIKPRSGGMGGTGFLGGKKKVNLEKFLIFNQQFVTLIRAGGASTKVELFKDPSEGYMNAMTVPGDASSKEIAMIKEAIDGMPF